jgi:hypothetical protein
MSSSPSVGQAQNALPSLDEVDGPVPVLLKTEDRTPALNIGIQQGAIAGLTHFRTCIRVLAAILALAAGGLGAQPVPAPAPAPVPERWAMDAINASSAEAKERVQNGIPVTTPWRTLTPQLLAQLMQRPEFAEAWADAATLFIDQAGAWDLLHFDKPSDILASWQRWRPNDPSYKPIAPEWKERKLDTLRSGFGADFAYSDKAGAWMILWNCLPEAAWRVHHTDPMTWAMEREINWDYNFAGCVRSREGNIGYWKRATPVLEQKLSSYLLTQGCSRTGPDDCLTLLHALVSLSPRHPDLVQIAASMAPFFKPRLEAALPATLLEQRGSLDEKEFEAAQRARRDLMRQILFLDAWLAILIEQSATSTPTDEPANSVKQLLRLTSELARLDQIQDGSFQPRLRDEGNFANPWERADKAAEFLPTWRMALDATGFAAAAMTGCELPELFSNRRIKISKRLLHGLAIGKLMSESYRCGSLNSEELAKDYGRGVAHPEELATIEPLHRFLGDESHARVHNEIVAALGAQCPLANDPWGVCDWVGDRSNKRLTAAQRRLPLRKSDEFISKPFFAQTDTPIPADRQTAKLLERVRVLRPQAEPQVAERMAELSRQGDISIDTLWTHPRHPQIAVLLHVAPQDTQTPLTGVSRTGQVLLVFGQSQASLVSLPGGLGQYDDVNLAALSDIDGDMHLEAWFVGVHGECDGESEIPGETCSIDQFQLGGEVFGSELSPYIQGPPPTRRK